jgi:hypothetical protein
MFVSAAQIETDCFVLKVSLKSARRVPRAKHYGIALLLTISIAFSFESFVIELERRLSLARGSAVDNAWSSRGHSRSSNLALHFIDYLCDLVFGQMREVVLWRQCKEGMCEMLAVAHQVQQFQVIIAISSPHLIASDPLQSLKPLLKPNPHVLTTGVEKVTLLDLSLHQTIFRVFRGLPFR